MRNFQTVVIGFNVNYTRDDKFTKTNKLWLWYLEEKKPNIMGVSFFIVICGFHGGLSTLCSGNLPSSLDDDLRIDAAYATFF